MGRYSRIPDLLNECDTVSVTSLIKWGYLKPGKIHQGTITWSRNGNKLGCIDIAVNTISENPYLELNYCYRQNPVKYRVELVSIPSNIGRGRVWYFLCPATGKRCRNLYRVGAKFLHREAHAGPGCMYETQTYSSRNRFLVRQYDRVFGRDKLHEHMYKKHSRTHYAGKPTKRYLNLLKKVEQANGISITALMTM
jgi:hypothetical protein